MKSISCFLPYQDDTATRSTVRQLTCSPLVEKIYLLVPADKKEPQIPSCASIRINDLWSSETIRTIAEHSTTEFILIYTQGDALKLGPFALDRLATLASETNAGLLYADYQETKGEKTEPHPLIDYQEGLKPRIEPEALALLQENARRLHAPNLTAVSGLAPEACLDLPAPTHAFIGGSSGNMEAILNACWEKNPRCRVVAAAVALETVAELTRLSKLHPAEILTLTAAQAHKVGPYSMMQGQNPIYLFTFSGK